jgi:hypothetical protein
MIFFRFWDRQNSIFLSSVLFFQICRKRDFFNQPINSSPTFFSNHSHFQTFFNPFSNVLVSKSRLQLHKKTFPHVDNEWFDWSNISYHPMTSFITVLTTIVSGFISTCGNVFLCSCRRDFDTKTLENGSSCVKINMFKDWNIVESDIKQL